MSRTRGKKKRINLSKEEWFLLFSALLEKVFPGIMLHKTGFLVSLSNFPKEPRSRRQRDYYQFLVKLKDALFNSYEKFERAKTLIVTLELTPKEVDQLKNLLPALQADPRCEEHTRSMIRVMLKRLKA